MPQAILASEDPASEEEGINASSNTESTIKCDDKEASETVEKKEEKIGAKDKSNKVEAKSSSKKSKNSYSIAALCQVNMNFGVK